MSSQQRADNTKDDDDMDGNDHDDDAHVNNENDSAGSTCRGPRDGAVTRRLQTQDAGAATA